MTLIRYSPIDDLFRTFANLGEPLGRDEYLPTVHIVELRAPMKSPSTFLVLLATIFTSR